MRTATPPSAAAATRWAALAAATAELDPPLAVLDHDALLANAAGLVARAGGVPIRVASKSVRCRAVLREVLSLEGFRGVLGSGLYGPTLFDHYRGFRPLPAALFALPVVRVPAPGMVTVLGGGWVASGPAGRDRLPTPVWPPGLRLLAAEGAGEVQTPLAEGAAFL